MEIKRIDNQGRISLPKSWRDTYLKGKKAILVFKGDSIEIRPYTRFDFARYFDKVEVDLKSDLSDWHHVRKELRRT